VNLAAMPYPEAYIPAAATLFDEAERLANAETRQFLQAFMEAFAAWVARLQPSR
jgi:chromate reductase